jgi:ketosteroid isomerase-like protein
MMNEVEAHSFAIEWIEAWNAHDLERVLGHYADHFDMSSPFISPIAGEPSGRLRGKPAIRAYWAKALEMVPDLRFKLIDVRVGVDSIVIHYHGHKGPVAEVLRFGEGGKVVSASAHY